MPPPEWEIIIENETEDTDRLRVPGGWLYRVRIYRTEYDDVAGSETVFLAMTTTFVPDQSRS